MSENKKEIKEEVSSDEMPVEMFVGQELGSTGSVQVLDENDSRQNTMLNEAEVLAISYFEQIPTLEGGDYAKAFCESFRRHKMSLNGWRANQLIRLVAGSKGVAAGKIVRKPGFIGRHLTDRGWKEKAQLEGAEIIE